MPYLWRASTTYSLNGFESGRCSLSCELAPGVDATAIVGVLPDLPRQLASRFVGQDLLLLDRDTRMILDVLRDVLPSRGEASATLKDAHHDRPCEPPARRIECRPNDLLTGG